MRVMLGAAMIAASAGLAVMAGLQADILTGSAMGS